ncbi:hypothetical protein [Undibacterium sp. Xuan67W]|uniref:hypothetical protein n=1 Tax=Undibacterium sp. Xuan67W TaxID=3413057 RepID=UPI003BF05C61
MFYKKPYLEHFELVAVNRIYVLEKMSADDVEVRFELADGTTLNRIYTIVEYSELMIRPPRVII